jgi:hypothetical protein
VSRTSEISIQCYLRKDEPKRGADGMADDMGHNDIFMGSIKVTPDFDNMGSEDQWYNLSAGSGKVKLGTSYQPTYVGLVSMGTSDAHYLLSFSYRASHLALMILSLLL